MFSHLVFLKMSHKYNDEILKNVIKISKEPNKETEFYIKILRKSNY